MYLDVLPAFLLSLLVFGSATLIAGLTRAGKPLFPYLWRAFFGSTAGVLGANALFWVIVVGVGSVLTAMDPSDQVRRVATLPPALELLLQPIPISLFGALAGIAFGVAWGCHANRQPNQHAHNRNLSA